MLSLKKIPGVNAAIFEIISDDNFNLLEPKKNHLHKKMLLNIILNGFNKVSVGNGSIFSNQIANKLKEKPEFNRVKKDTLKTIDTLMMGAIDEYKRGIIKFKF